MEFFARSKERHPEGMQGRTASGAFFKDKMTCCLVVYREKSVNTMLYNEYVYVTCVWTLVKTYFN
jgi:ribosomal protein S17